MADEATLTSANSTESWVQAYYGDDAFDYKKVEKLRHIKHTGQFASFCYVISKNTKQAHTDFFEDNYTTVDKMYARVAELILKLLYVKFNEERNLTRADFDACGGAELFGGRPNYDQIVSDYIGAGGMVDMCQTLIPISTDNAKTAKNIKEINDDMDNVKKDHTRLLAITKSTDGTLSRDQIFDMFAASSDCCSKAWKTHKKNKSKGELELQKDMEDAYMYRYDLAKKSGKMAILAGTTVASIGAIVGGVFWPALLLLPVHSLSKKWIPDWFKSMGSMWGNFEKRFKSKRAIDRAAAFQQYIVSYAETGGKPKLPWKYRRLVRPADIALLKKQAKLVKEGLTLEGTDGKVHKSAMDEALDAISGSKSFGTLLNNQNGDGLVPADAADVLSKRLGVVPSLTGGSEAETALMREKALKHETDAKPIPTFAEFTDLARTYKNWKSNLSTDAQRNFEYSYSEKLLDSAELLIFGTPMETMTDFVDKVSKYFAEDSVIMEPVKEVRPDVLEIIKRYVTFASKELTGLEGKNSEGEKKWKGKTLYQYIHREASSLLNDHELAGEEYNEETRVWTGGFVNPTDSKLVSAIACIRAMESDPSSDLKIVSKDNTSATPDKYIDLGYINNLISDITDPGDRKKVNKLLQAQMKKVFYNASREDSRKTYEAITDGDFNGKSWNLAEKFKTLGEMNYENVGSATYSQMYYTFSDSKLSPKAVARYMRGKMGKAAYDVFASYVLDQDKRDLFVTDLSTLIAFLRKVNGCTYLNEQQKAELSASVSSYVKESFDLKIKLISKDFMEQYKKEEINNYLESDYSSATPGFKTLFKTDKSSETQEVKKKLEFLNTLSAVQSSLKLDGFKMGKDDELIIGKVLLRDSADDFDSVKVRPAGDLLVGFLTKKLNSQKSYANFGAVEAEKLEEAITANETPYAEIVEKLEYIFADPGPDPANIKGMGNCSCFDKYAALVALKNRCIVEFRSCLTQLVTDCCGDSYADTWLQSEEGKKLYSKVLDTWSNGIFQEIDNKFVELLKNHPELAKIGEVSLPISTERKRYTEKKISLSQDKVLG